jgi:trimeric autotransporter adhesin
VATGSYDGIVRALAVDGASLYAGGNFKPAGGTVANNIAKYDGHDWSRLGSGIGGSLETVFALGVRGHRLYVGGDFTSAGQLSVTNAAVWNGAEWLQPGFQTNAAVRSIVVNGADVYVGGAAFTLESGRRATGVLNCGTGCSVLGTGIGNGRQLAPIETLAVSRKRIYVGGGPFALPNADN